MQYLILDHEKFKTTISKDELNQWKLKFYLAFRSQELWEYYNSLIKGDDKFVSDKFWKLKLKQQLEAKKNYKVKPKTKTTEIQKTITATINEGDTSVHQVAI